MTDSAKTAGSVLVVEDEALVRMLVVQAFEEAGLIVHEAGEANGALEILRTTGGIRLMVTDVGLPGMDGRRLADQTRLLRPDMRVLFMTGYADTALVETALPAGFGLINKPFDLDDLIAKVRGLMEA